MNFEQERDNKNTRLKMKENQKETNYFFALLRAFFFFSNLAF